MRLLLALLFCFRLHSQEVTILRQSGPAQSRINVVVLTDGYTTNQQAKALTDASAIFEAIRAGFGSDTNLIDGYACRRASAESGADEPTKGVYRDTYYNSSFDSGYVGGMDRLLVIDYWGNLRAISDAANTISTNVLAVVVVNSTRYGGSGGMTLVASVNGSSAEVARHEMGHTFAGLADEYCTAYPGWVQREAPNSSTNQIKPPWASITTNWIAGSQYNCTVWGRPFQECRMKTLGRAWCAVCESHLAKVVRLKTGGAVPGRRTLTLRLSEQVPLNP